MKRIIAALPLVLALTAGPTLAFQLTSADVTDGGTLKPDQVAGAFGCTGGNVSPQLAWSDPPAGTRSFVVTMFDPDAPTGSGFWHWVVFDIPAGATGLPRGAGTPDGALLPHGAIQSRADANLNGYLGACPPIGAKPHRYVITVRAVGLEKLGLDASASGALVGFVSNAAKLGEATITATFGR